MWRATFLFLPTPFHSVVRVSLVNRFLFGRVQQAVRQPKAVGAKIALVLLCCFCPHYPPYGSKKAVTLLAVHHNLRSGSYLCSMVSFIPCSFTITTELLSSTSLRLSTTSVSFRPSVSQQAIIYPLPIIFACLSACFGCGFVILFAKKRSKKIRQTLMSGYTFQSF